MKLPNPLIPGFNPDPSIVRVGEDYYLTTSTFEYRPGLPIYHSKDLVNWQLVSHVIQRPGYDNADSMNVVIVAVKRFSQFFKLAVKVRAEACKPS